MLRFLHYVLILIIVFAFAGEARAESGAALVAIVTSEPSSLLTRRVGEELRSLGLDVIVIKPPAEASTSREPLEQAARNVGAVAAVRLVVSGAGKVEVWVADRVTGKAVVRELDASPTDANVTTVALGTVELFRASLMELHATDPPHGEVKPTPQIEALALPTPAPPAPSARAALAIGAGGSVAGAGVAPEIAAGAWIRAADRFGALLTLHATLAPARSSSMSGSVDVGWQTLGAAATYDFGDPANAQWLPRLAVGVVTTHVSATGTAIPPYISAAEGAWLVGPSLSLGVARTIAAGLRIRADAGAAYEFPSREIRTPTTTIGRFGAPALTLAISAELVWLH